MFSIQEEVLEEMGLGMKINQYSKALKMPEWDMSSIQV